MADKKKSEHIMNTVVGYNGLFVLTLNDVTRYSDYKAMWATSGLWGKSAMTIKSALDSHKHEVDDDRLLVYTDVIIRVPGNIYIGLLRDEKIGWITKNLQELHRKQFGKQLLYNRTPSYMIVSDDRIKEGCAEVVFGVGVFVPNVNDRLLYTVEIEYATSPGRPVPLLWDLKHVDSPVPVGIYENQNMGIQIGSVPGPFVIDSKEWEKLPYSQIHISRSIKDRNVFRAIVTMKEDGTLGIEGFTIKMNPSKDEFVLSVYHQNAKEDPSKLLLNIRLRKHEASPEIIIEQNHSDDPIIDDPDPGKSRDDQEEVENTLNQDRLDNIKTPENKQDVSDTNRFVFDKKDKEQEDIYKTNILIRESFTKGRVSIEGFMLPRIDKIPILDPVLNDELESWILWFDDTCKPLLSEPKPGPAALTIRASRNNADLLLMTDGKTEVLTKFPFYGDIFSILEPPNQIEDIYIGILKRPFIESAMTLKKNEEMVCGRARDTHLKLNLFDVKNCLRYSQGSIQSNWDRLLTSSRHISLEQQDDQTLKVTQLSKSNSIYILDQNNNLLDELPPVNDAGQPQSIMIKHMQRIVVGLYLLEYRSDISL
jgi:hypothetical protein